MKIILSAILLFAAFSGDSQTHVYPKKFNANPAAVYITNSNSDRELVFPYTTPADTSKSLFLIENLKFSDIEPLVRQLRFKNLQFCPDNYRTKVGDLVFAITSEKRMIYFFHFADTSSLHTKKLIYHETYTYSHDHNIKL